MESPEQSTNNTLFYVKKNAKNKVFYVKKHMFYDNFRNKKEQRTL